MQPATKLPAEPLPIRPDVPAEVLSAPEVQRDLDLLRNRGGTALDRMQAKGRLFGRGVLADDTPAAPEPSLKIVGAPEPAAAPSPSQGNPKPGTAAPPAVNHAAEQGVLALALLDNAALDGPLAEVLPEHLYDRTRRTVFEAMRDLHGAGHAFDQAVLLDALERGGRLTHAEAAAALGFLATIPVRPELGERHAEIVRADAERRNAASLAELLREAGGGKVRAADVVHRARGLIERLDPTAPADDELGYRPWPEPPGEAAWNGVAGDLVRAIAPHTEADPVAILAQLLVCFGSVLGRTAHWSVDAARHYCNLYVVIAGQSSRGRKGTAWQIVRHLIGGLDPAWRKECIQSGLNSGEGLIDSIRDDQVAKNGEFVAGVEDKRSLWVESEFSATIGVMNREGNSLSGYLRKAWDGETLRSATKNQPVTATDPHVSLIGHTTFAELAKRLSLTESLNGFANRFLWVCARRSKELPEGGDFQGLDLDWYRNRLTLALKAAEKRGNSPVPFDDRARELWKVKYSELSRPRAGRLGPVTDRAEAQTRRLAVIYAALDRSPKVRLEHLGAALEFWAYCERSAAYVFGDAESDPVAERIVEALRKSPEKGLSRNQINRDLFHGKEAPLVAEALRGLITAGLVDVRVEKSGRTRATFFVLTGLGKTPESARSARSSGSGSAT